MSAKHPPLASSVTPPLHDSLRMGIKKLRGKWANEWTPAHFRAVVIGHVGRSTGEVCVEGALSSSHARIRAASSRTGIVVAHTALYLGSIMSV
jgi:hypothetical protein